MLYALFLGIAILYNFRKFQKGKGTFIRSILEAKAPSHREMILGHHFYVFIFECFLALIVAHLISEKVESIGLIEMAIVYLLLLCFGFFLYRPLVKFLERQTELKLQKSFNQHLIRELRVNFALIMLPIVIYSAINWASQDGIIEEWGSFWVLGILVNILFVSVLTVICTVIVMLRLIPNREVTEPEYLDIINRRLSQIGAPKLRVRWIEADIKNAFIVGLKILRFSNQTMFIGRSLRTTLTLSEFDAVVAHELSHVVNRHVHKRMIDLIKNSISLIIGSLLIMLFSLGFAFIYWWDDAGLYMQSLITVDMFLILAWILFNYALLFDGIRAHEFEADAYAVLNLGIDFEALKSALEKLSSKDEMPDYLKDMNNKSNSQIKFVGWGLKTFSTHPDLPTRLKSLEIKIQQGLPYNHYVSTAQKVRGVFGKLFQWKVALPMASFMVSLFLYSFMRIQDGNKMIRTITQSSTEELLKNSEIALQINSKPSIIGPSLMYYVVKRKDRMLIDYYLSNGADKAKTLGYISELKDIGLFKTYFNTYQNRLSKDEFSFLLSKAATLNFIEGYRHLVNSKNFEQLSPSLKDHANPKRAPASTTP